MDNLTHSLTGVALSRAGLDRFSPRAVWLLILSANAPDGDIVFATKGAFRYLEVHRGYSHSFLGAPFIAALCVLVTALLFRQKLPWFRAWLVSLVGIASHLLLDATNTYGIRLLLPFSSSWFHFDLNSLYDGWILAVLLLAAIWPGFSKLVNREIGDRRPPNVRVPALLALIFFLVFDLTRFTLHNNAVTKLESRLYDGLPPIHTAALPDPFNPVSWTGVVETAGTFQLAAVNALSSSVVETSTAFYKPPPTPALVAARQTDVFRYFLYFARFPVWSVQPVLGEQATGERLDLTDLRFGRPGSGSFHCVAYVDAKSAVVTRRFTYGSGRDLGWKAAE